MALQEEESQQLQSPAFVLDGLFCEEEGFEDDYAGFDDGRNEIYDQNVKNESSLSPFLVEQDLFWEDAELLSLMSKEKETHLSFGNEVLEEHLVVARAEAVGWVFKVKEHYGFTALTAVLAVNYFDRFISSLEFQKDKPWMAQLIAVACLSLAAKVEETQVPLLLDLQVEESRYVFEAKTIKRMELLVLSNLQWRMNAVTPISFLDHILRRLGLKNDLHLEFLWLCERLILSVIADSRFICYLPSMLATAIMLHVIEDVEPCNKVEYQNQLLGVLKVDEDKLNDCYKLILGLSGRPNQGCKRKYMSTPSSPSAVIDASFISDSSNDSWVLTSTVLSSPAPKFKRRRAQDQQMRLPSINRMFVDILSSPH